MRGVVFLRTLSLEVAVMGLMKVNQDGHHLAHAELPGPLALDETV